MGACLLNLKGQISDKSRPVRFEKSAAFLKKIQRKPRAYDALYHVPVVIRAGSVGVHHLDRGTNLSRGSEVCFLNFSLHISASRIYAKANHLK